MQHIRNKEDKWRDKMASGCQRETIRKVVEIERIGDEFGGLETRWQRVEHGGSSRHPELST